MARNEREEKEGAGIPMSLLGHAPVTSPLTQIPFQRLDHLPVVPKLRTELNTWAFQRYSNNLASSPQKKSY